MSKVYVIQSTLGRQFSYLGYIETFNAYTTKNKAIDALKTRFDHLISYIDKPKENICNYGNYIKTSFVSNNMGTIETCYRLIELPLNEAFNNFCSLWNENEVPLYKYLKY